MSNKRTGKQKDDSKDLFDKSNDNLMAQLKKHMNDWFDDHQGAEFITPRQFQNAYPKWDKYLTESFRNIFYAVKKRILAGEIFILLLIYLFSWLQTFL